MKKLRSWERADHRFALVSFALLGFLALAGMTAWLLGEKPSVAAVSQPSAPGGSLQR
jgi:hypothetical protein